MDNWHFSLSDEVWPWFWTGAAGMLGRLTYHAVQVQRGKRKPFTIMMLWDMPVALFCGWSVFGLAKYLSLGWEPSISAAMVASYLGPNIFDIGLSMWVEKYGTKPSTEKEI